MGAHMFSHPGQHLGEGVRLSAVPFFPSGSGDGQRPLAEAHCSGSDGEEPALAPTVGVPSCSTGFQLHTVCLAGTPHLCVLPSMSVAGVFRSLTVLSLSAGAACTLLGQIPHARARLIHWAPAGIP